MSKADARPADPIQYRLSSCAVGSPHASAEPAAAPVTARPGPKFVEPKAAPATKSVSSKTAQLLTVASWKMSVGEVAVEVEA